MEDYGTHQGETPSMLGFALVLVFLKLIESYGAYQGETSDVLGFVLGLFTLILCTSAIVQAFIWKFLALEPSDPIERLGQDVANTRSSEGQLVTYIHFSPGSLILHGTPMASPSPNFLSLNSESQVLRQQLLEAHAKIQGMESDAVEANAKIRRLEEEQVKFAAILSQLSQRDDKINQIPQLLADEISQFTQPLADKISRLPQLLANEISKLPQLLANEIEVLRLSRGNDHPPMVQQDDLPEPPHQLLARANDQTPQVDQEVISIDDSINSSQSSQEEGEVPTTPNRAIESSSSGSLFASPEFSSPDGWIASSPDESTVSVVTAQDSSVIPQNVDTFINKFLSDRDDDRITIERDGHYLYRRFSRGSIRVKQKLEFNSGKYGNGKIRDDRPHGVGWLMGLTEKKYVYIAWMEGKEVKERKINHSSVDSFF